MYTVDVYTSGHKSPSANIKTLSVKRKWMERGNASEYHCFPVSLSNRLGWAVSFPEDIILEWDGDPIPNKETSMSVKSGEQFCWNQRGAGAVTLNTNLIFRTNEDTSLLTLPVPNQFIDGVQVMTSIISSSFYTGGLQIVLQVTRPNQEIKIPAGTPVATLVPLSLTQFQDSVAVIHKKEAPFKDIHGSDEYNEGIWKIKKESSNEMSNCYSKAVDHLGNKIGSHQIKSFNFIVKEDE